MSTTTLSPVVVRIGGALTDVMTDVQKYADRPVDKRSKLAVARLVERRPHLNNELSIAMLIDLSVFHGVMRLSELGAPIDEHGLPAVHLAVDYLYECGERSQAGDKTNQHITNFGVRRRYKTGIQSIDKVAALILDLSAITGASIESADYLDDLLERLGGLDTALDMSSPDLQTALAVEFELDSGNDAEDGDQEDDD